MAIQFWINRGERGRTKIVGFKSGYHGDTFATMAICDPDEGMHALFKGALAEQFVVELPRDAAQTDALDDLLKREKHRVAAVIVEPLVQGAAGMKFHSAQVLRRVAEIARRHGAILILDEIFTGFARTGTMFAMEQANIVPDIVCLGKALTGGTLPLAATIASGRIFDGLLSDDPDARNGRSRRGKRLVARKSGNRLVHQRRPFAQHKRTPHLVVRRKARQSQLQMLLMLRRTPVAAIDEAQPAFIHRHQNEFGEIAFFFGAEFDHGARNFGVRQQALQGKAQLTVLVNRQAAFGLVRFDGRFRR
jgi:hypothetical protein